MSNISKLHPIYYSLRSNAHISVDKALAHAIGFNEAALFAELLSRHDYFESRNSLTPDGFFFNTVDDLWSGTTLSGYQQRLAIANLKKLGLIETQITGIPAKRYFRVVNSPQKVQELLEFGKEKARKVHESTSNQVSSLLAMKKLNTNKNNNNGGPDLYPLDTQIDRELMDRLSVELSAHEQAKPTKKEILRRIRRPSAQGA